MKVTSYKELIVWQKSVDSVLLIYDLTKYYPNEEKFGLTSQIRRAAVSIPSNIAEGKARGTRKDYRSFIVRAYASGAELETQIEISKRLQLTDSVKCNKVDLLLNEVMRMLNKLVESLGENKNGFIQKT